VPKGKFVRERCRFDITEAMIQEVLSKQHEMTPLKDSVTPTELITKEQVQELMAIHNPHFVPVLGREDEGPTPPADPTVGVVQRRLSNGCTLNYKVSDNDPNSAGMRICMSGGRAAEVTSGAGPAGVAAMQVGLRTSTACFCCTFSCFLNFRFACMSFSFEQRHVGGGTVWLGRGHRWTCHCGSKARVQDDEW
jgi:hypothetical protein